MKIYYFIHIVGRDQGNSGIPRVSRNLGAALDMASGITLVPVRWDEASSAIVHVESVFLDTMRLYGGPNLKSGGIAGQPVHLDKKPGHWLLIPEVPQLGSHDNLYPPVQFPLITGYARQYGMRTGAIFHDAMPLTHFGEENSGQPNGLGFLIYVLGLGECDILLPVSRASSEALTGLFGRYGILPTFDRTVKPILLPEEVIGEQSLAYLKTSSREHQNSIEFCMWGTIFPHKNFVSGMEAFNILCQRRPDLDLRLHHVGSVSGESMDAVRRLVRQSRGRIILHGFVSDAELSMIARRSRASIFVSLAEGYGLPLSESLWLGLPCITSAFAPMTEIAAGGGALLVDPTDTESIARGIEKIATDSVLYERLKNELRARNFRTWKQYSYEVLQEIRAVDVTARERVHVLNYIPLRSTSASMQLEVLGFDLSDMSIPEAYDAVSVPLVADGVLKYERDEHFAVSHPVICFGPYVTVGAGRYVIVFDGILKGKCLICITSDEGRNIYLEKIIDTLETKLEFVTDKIMSKMEIVFTKTPELESLSLDAIWVTRYSLS